MKQDQASELRQIAKMAGRQVIVKSWTQIKSENEGQFINSRLYWCDAEGVSKSYAIVAVHIQAGHKIAKALFLMETGLVAKSCRSGHISGHEDDTDTELWIAGLEDWTPSYQDANQVAEDLAAVVHTVDPSWAKVIQGPNASVTVFGMGPFTADAIVGLEGLAEEDVAEITGHIQMAAAEQGFHIEPISVYTIGVYDHREGGC